MDISGIQVQDFPTLYSEWKGSLMLQLRTLWKNRQSFFALIRVTPFFSKIMFTGPHSSSGIHEKGVHKPLSPVSGVTSRCSNSISAAPGWPGWAACKRGARLSFSAESRVASVNSKGLLICTRAYGQLPKKEVFNTLYLHY